MRSATFGLVLLASFAAAAQDRFEIQVYDSEVAEQGHFGLELHSNYVVEGSKVASTEGELPTNHQLHLTLEPHVGVFGWGELGAYFQGALRPDGTVDFAGAKLRFKAKWPHKLLDERVGLAINFELSRVPHSYEANVWGSEIRPVADVRLGPVYLALNPIVAIDLQGAASGKPQFEPAAKVAFFLLDSLSVGAESYSGFGPFESFVPGPEQNHHLFGALDFVSDWFDFNVGVGRGFDAGDPWVVKSIIGFHPPGTPPSHAPPPGATPEGRP